MIVTVLAYTPFIACLFWLVLNPFVHKKDRSFRILQLLLAITGTSTLAEAELVNGGNTEQLVFYFIRQFVTILIIPVAIVYIKSLTQSDKKTHIIGWISVPVSLLIAQIALSMTFGKDSFIQCVVNHTNILTLKQERDSVELLIHICSFWLFYGILTVELISFGIFSFLRGVQNNISLQHKGVMTMIVAYTVIEALQLSLSTDKVWLEIIMLILLSVSIFLMAFAALFRERADLSFQDIIKMNTRLVLSDQDDLTRKDARRTAPISIVSIPQKNQTDDGYLKARFDELILTNRMYLKKGIRISDVAKMLRTNRTYISKLVNDTYGMSFSDYINTLRIKFAQEYLIEHPDIKQSDIAAVCGFPDASAFNNIFKKVTGMTPKIWLASNP
ncbi:MAG: AraC family transcriptional regulator [Bacteroidaceae bacterium]|nr:AraC family transcriptional regulator [Bacteroidaceae bacterium]